MKKLPVISVCLVVVNILVYLVCLFDGGRLYSAGCLDANAILGNREYGRIVWAMFLHASTEHLFSNMIITLFLGAMIEKEVGPIRYGLVYLLSGVGGNLLSLFWKVVQNDSAVSIGASGAVFGLDGMLIAMVFLLRKQMVRVTPARVVVMVFFSLYSGFASGNIDNAAHIGGLVTGFVFGCITCFAIRRKNTVMYEGGTV